MQAEGGLAVATAGMAATPATAAAAGGMAVGTIGQIVQMSVGNAGGDAPEVVASDAAQGFGDFQCKECTDSIVNAMKQKGLNGEILDIRTISRQGQPSYHNIYSDSLGRNISTNGTHRAVRVGNTVFDNLHPNGIPFDQWLNDLKAPFSFNLGVTPF